MYNNQNDMRERLAAPFDDNDIEWRLQWSDKNKENGIAVPYVTNRAIQTRLDRVFGVDGWKNEFIPWHSDGKKSSQLCGISVWLYERREWVTKYDGADDSDIEPIKGGLSDAMKRAAVQWGIGRYLYSMPTVYVKCETRGNSAVIRKSEYPKLNKAHSDHVKSLSGIPIVPDKPDSPTHGSRPEPADRQPPPDKPEPQKAPNKRNATDKRSNPNSPNTPAVPPAPISGASNTTSATPAAPPAPPDKPNTAVVTNTAYTVVKALPVSSVKRGSDTNLLLADKSGKQTQAYMRGSDPGLTPGAVIADAMITEKLSNGVIFRILEKYNIVADGNAA
jgi:hypothetical protein